MKRLFASAIVGSALLLASQATHAASLGLDPGIPDIKSSVSVSYTGGVFTATGNSAFAVELDGDPNQEMTILGNYVLSAYLSPSGSLLSGSLFVDGTLLDESFDVLADGLLLSGPLTNFGFTDGADQDVFEFLFNATSVDPNLPFGAKGGIIITTQPSKSNFAGSFAGTFNGGTADSDTFVQASVPTPAAASAGWVLLGGLAAFRRRRPLVA